MFNKDPEFNWIFDCGSSSNRKYIERELAICGQLTGANRINLLCVSHFDKDHYNGLKRLLATHTVRHLVMPYWSLVDRMSVAVPDNAVDEQYIDYLHDPAGHIYRYVEAIGREGLTIHWIMPSGEPASESPDAQGSTDSVLSRADPWALEIPGVSENEAGLSATDICGVSDVSPRHKPKLVPSRTSMVLSGVWEFIFFNESVEKPLFVSHLREEVLAALRGHQSPNGLINIPLLIEKLQRVYTCMIPTSKERNRQSLVAFMGVKQSIPCEWGRFRVISAPATDRLVAPPLGDIVRWGPCAGTGCAIMYYGDYPMGVRARNGRVEKFFGRRRLDLVGVRQIPHHGAEDSWAEGLGQGAEERINVISSRANDSKHPHESVLSHLEGENIVLVNEVCRAHVYGCYTIKVRSR